jgi:hypothetical protein
MTFQLTNRNKRRLIAVGRWLLPLVLSGAASTFIGWGAVQHAKGVDAQRLTTVERDVQELRDVQKEFVRRDAFGILVDDVKEIKRDVRDIHDRTTQGAPK